MGYVYRYCEEHQKQCYWSPHGRYCLREMYCKHHDKVCIWTLKGTTCVQRREEMRETKAKAPVEITELKCKGCELTLPVSEFHKQKSSVGYKSKCKSCIRVKDTRRLNTWPSYVKKKVAASFKAHKNDKCINAIKYEDAMELLIKQDYKCLHCGISLENTAGDLLKKNCNGASLDRIDVDIIGYGNGNAQWLCMSCNNGKNTMNTLDHKEKFASRDRRICELEEECDRLKKLLAEHNIEF